MTRHRPWLSKAGFFRLHSWLGVVTGAFLLVIAWSGSLVVFNDEIEWLLDPAVRADPSRASRPTDALITAMQDAWPGRRIALHLQIGPAWVHTGFVYERGLTRYLLIDPATAEIRRADPMTGYTFSVSYFLRQLHIRLLMGAWGRVFVGLFGVTLVLSAVTSLVVYRQWLASLVRLRRTEGRRIFHMDLHKAVGLWTIAFSITFGATGAVLGLENLYYRVWPAALAAEVQEVTARTPPRLPAGLSAGGILQALAASDAAFVPTVVEVTPDGPVVVRGNHPGAFIADGASEYRVMAATGAVTTMHDARRATWPAFLYNILDPLHFGYFGERWGLVPGYVVEGLWFLTGLAPGLLAITGAVMWLERQRRRPAAAAASSPAPPWSASQRIAYAVVCSAFIAAGYALQATVWGRGWIPSELLWQHWIVKPLCLAVVCLPLSWASVRLGGLATRRHQPWPVLRAVVAAVPPGLIYLAATAVLN